MNAKALADVSSNVGGIFSKGSNLEASVKKNALADIWAKPADFKAAHGRLVDAIEKFASLGKRGNFDAIKAAMPSLGLPARVVTISSGPSTDHGQVTSRRT